MKQLTCEMCGSTDLLKEDGVFICQSCGCKYSVEEAKKMMVEGTVEVTGTVQVDKSKILEKILDKIYFYIKKGDFLNPVYTEAEEYNPELAYNPELIKLFKDALEIDPTNGKVFLAKLLMQLRCHSIEELIRVKKDEITSNDNYKLLMQFADADLKKKVQDYATGNFDWEIVLKGKSWTWLDDGVASKFYSQSTKVELPEFVTGLHIHAFEDFENLQEIVFPKGFDSDRIPSYAFRNCTQLSKITIPESVREIENRAFEGCTQLSEIALPESVCEIDSGAFSKSGLITFTFPKNITKIPDWCFFDCTKLTTVVLPENVTEIEQNAFSWCKNLSKVFIGQTEVTIRYLGSVMGYKYYRIVEYPHINVKEDAFGFCPCVIEASPKSSPQQDRSSQTSSSGCYVATCVYGSYDCPEVWTLRRFRDDTLGSTWYGRLFIRTYYAISPTLVKWFGHANWFKKMWKEKLDRMVAKLQSNGVENTPYEDKEW